MSQQRRRKRKRGWSALTTALFGLCAGAIAGAGVGGITLQLGTDGDGSAYIGAAALIGAGAGAAIGLLSALAALVGAFIGRRATATVRGVLIALGAALGAAIVPLVGAAAVASFRSMLLPFAGIVAITSVIVAIIVAASQGRLRNQRGSRSRAN